MFGVFCSDVDAPKALLSVSESGRSVRSFYFGQMTSCLSVQTYCDIPHNLRFAFRRIVIFRIICQKEVEMSFPFLYVLKNGK